MRLSVIAALGVFCLTFNLVVAQPAREAKPLLKNSAFEDGTKGWSLAVYGAQPTIAVDTSVVRKGNQSLRIAAAEPSDAALAQDIAVRPGSCYRFGGWVRTRQLDPRGAPVFATFQVQGPGGRGILAS